MDEPTSTSNDDSWVDPDLVDNGSNEDEDLDEETRNVVNAWEQSQELGSANTAIEESQEPKSDEEMFPVVQDDIDKWRKDNKNYSSWMTDSQVAFIIRRQMQDRFEKHAIKNIKRTERRKRRKVMSRIEDIEHQIGYGAIGAEPRRPKAVEHDYERRARNLHEKRIKG